MKLLRKETRFNDTTYQPEVILTFAVPLEPICEAKSNMSTDELSAMLGKAFLDAMTEYEG